MVIAAAFEETAEIDQQDAAVLDMEAAESRKKGYGYGHGYGHSYGHGYGRGYGHGYGHGKRGRRSTDQLDVLDLETAEHRHHGAYRGRYGSYRGGSAGYRGGYAGYRGGHAGYGGYGYHG